MMRSQFGEEYYAEQEDDEKFVTDVKKGRIIQEEGGEQEVNEVC